jgi:hypothetical protein
MSLPLPILVSPLDFESFADLLPTVCLLLFDDYMNVIKRTLTRAG